MDVYSQMAVKIIAGQEVIIGPVAVEQAKQISNLKIDWPKHSISIDGNKLDAINDLIETYKSLFGQISVEVSREAISSLLGKLPAGQMPEALR